MRKSLIIACVIFVSLACTACINRFAVQELNNNAKELLSQGKVEAAIARLESSIDLDDSVFETHYNLAVAYIQANNYDKALDSLNKVKELNPDFADTYHSMAVCYEEKANAIISSVNNNGNENTEQEQQASGAALTEEQKTQVTEYLTNAIDNYNTYLSKKEDAKDKSQVEQKINDLNNQLKDYNDSADKAE